MAVPRFRVVTKRVHLPTSPSRVYEFTIAAPHGMLPVSGGYHTVNPSMGVNAPMPGGSYPRGLEWVFEFYPASVEGGFDLDLYAICWK
jgi:hypothetical protein